MRVAIFGGTGFVGGYLIDALIAARHEPSVLVRPGSESKVRHANRCRLVTGDVSSKIAINATLESCDVAVYMIGILQEFPKQGITFEELQYRSVIRVVEAAKDCSIAQLLLMSANGAKSPGTPYQETKFRAEQYAKAGGLDVTIFRPSVVFGDPRGLMEIGTQLKEQMISPPIPAIGFFTGWHPRQGAVAMSPVQVTDVAQAFVSALEDPSSVGRTYILAGPEILSWTEMLWRIAQATGRNKWIVPMPIRLMKVAATLFGWLPFFPVTRDQLTMLAEGNIGDPADLTALIGGEPQAFLPANLDYLRD